MAKDSNRDQKTGQFLQGFSGNPDGRGRGSRNKLGEAFIADLHAAWQEHGQDVIAATMAKDPAAFLRVVASILPKELDVNVNKYDGITDEQLRGQFLAAVREAAALGIDFGPGDLAGTNQAGEGTPDKPTVPGHGTA